MVSIDFRLSKISKLKSELITRSHKIGFWRVLLYRFKFLSFRRGGFFSSILLVRSLYFFYLRLSNNVLMTIVVF